MSAVSRLLLHRHQIMLLSSADPRTSGSHITLVTASHHHMSLSLSLSAAALRLTLCSLLSARALESLASPGTPHRPLPHSTEGWVIVIIWADYSAYSYQLSPPQYSSGSQKLTQVHCTALHTSPTLYVRWAQAPDTCEHENTCIQCDTRWGDIKILKSLPVMALQVQ